MTSITHGEHMAALGRAQRMADDAGLYGAVALTQIEKQCGGDSLEARAYREQIEESARWYQSRGLVVPRYLVLEEKPVTPQGA